jgi:hypothetical protein
MIGNYMNGTGIKGGAFGFRVSSINKVDLLSWALCLVDLAKSQFSLLTLNPSTIPRFSTSLNERFINTFQAWKSF